MLYLVATPIGNLGDMTGRAQKVLSDADVVLCEDTRVSRKLLQHIGVDTPLSVYHDFNKEKVTPRLVERLAAGERLALITDAGTPGIADPAFYLVREAIRAGIQVVPVPGASAVTAALTASGLPCDRFVFENFLPPKSARRRRVLETFKHEKRTVVFYESPHRIEKVLADMRDVLGDVTVVIARELTKIHEEFLRGTPPELLAHFEKKMPRGEMVVMLNTGYHCTA
ncbi:MAG: 16S rRNA (cytidine(1402)-2'-O)-methyltransferase [Chitinivibrionales bacterium]|nr:16S rRNA (cytidine(1402)-2'-O)-methyltransferase [Chitinivibrionales bacterium]MBD3397333.1 16S rRNA (cytidine(1402)-2'-O)-methyltransferase [Chitinivibrionales bacterium]